MRMTIEEVAALIAASSSRAAYDAKEIATLQERVLKLEYKYKELIDILTDLRAHQVMSTKGNTVAWNAPDIEPDEGRSIVIFKRNSAASGVYTSGNYCVYNHVTDQREQRDIEFWTYPPGGEDGKDAR